MIGVFVHHARSTKLVRPFANKKASGLQILEYAGEQILEYAGEWTFDTRALQRGKNGLAFLG